MRPRITIIVLAALVAVHPAHAHVDDDPLAPRAPLGDVTIPMVSPPPADPGADALYGEAGSRRWLLRGGGGFELDSSRDATAVLGVGIETFIADGVSIDLEIGGLYAEQSGADDAYGGYGSLMLSWHPVRRDRWSFFVEAGIGLQGSGVDIPPDGTSFNFTPRAGLGFTLALADAPDAARLRVGTRWYHVSNANLSRGNPGRDNVVLYAGISLPWR